MAEIDINDVYGATIIDKYHAKGAFNFMAETSIKSDELTKEKNELLSKPLDDENLDKVAPLLERIQVFQELLREGYKKFNIPE